jgi:hypothetical protein
MVSTSFECCEGSFYQTDDGVAHMMLRTDRQQLAVSESRDGGKTRTLPSAAFRCRPWPVADPTSR